MKRKILAVALISGVIALSALGTSAFFTGENTATNVITAGNIKIKLNERASALTEDGTDGFVEFEDRINVVPDTAVSKIVTVENEGEHPAYIRVYVGKEITLADGKEGVSDTSLIEMNCNKELWVEKDGYWYYTESLEPGQETEPLFTTVTFSKKMTNMYQNSTAKLDVRAFGVQSENNGDSPTEAAGWPENVIDGESDNEADSGTINE